MVSCSFGTLAYKRHAYLVAITAKSHGLCFYQESCPFKYLLLCILMFVTDFCLFYYSSDALLIWCSYSFVFCPCSLVSKLYGLIYGLIYSLIQGLLTVISTVISTVLSTALFTVLRSTIVHFTVFRFLVFLSWPSLNALHCVLVALLLTTKYLWCFALWSYAL